MQRYAPLLGLSVEEVGGALESIRAQAVARGKGNQTFRETSMATLELLLPREAKKVRRVESGLVGGVRVGGWSQSGVRDGGRNQGWWEESEFVGGVRAELVVWTEVLLLLPGLEDKVPPGDPAGRPSAAAGGQVRSPHLVVMS